MLAVLQRQLLLILTAGLVLTLGVAVYSYHSALNYEEQTDQVHRSYEVKEGLNTILRLLVDSESAQRGYLLTGDSSYLDPYREGVPQVEGRLSKLADLTRGNRAQQQMLADLRRLEEEKLAELQQTIQLHERGRDQDARRIVLSGRGKQGREEIGRSANSPRRKKDR